MADARSKEGTEERLKLTDSAKEARAPLYLIHFMDRSHWNVCAFLGVEFHSSKSKALRVVSFQ